MYKATKIVWIIATIIASSGLLWFAYFALFHYTAIGPGLGALFMFIWLPTLSFVIASIAFMANGKVPVRKITQILLIMFLVMFSCVFSRILLRESDVARQRHRILEENRRFREENRRTTTDGKFHYMLVLFELLTDNPQAMLSITDTATGNGVGIRIHFRFDEFRPIYEIIPLSPALLIELTPTDEENIYILTTTPYLKEKTEIFEINVAAGTARRLE